MFALLEVADRNALDQTVLGKITNAPDVQATETHIVLPSSVRQSPRLFFGGQPNEHRALLWEL